MDSNFFSQLASNINSSTTFSPSSYSTASTTPTESAPTPVVSVPTGGSSWRIPRSQGSVENAFFIIAPEPDNSARVQAQCRICDVVLHTTKNHQVKSFRKHLNKKDECKSDRDNLDVQMKALNIVCNQSWPDDFWMDQYNHFLSRTFESAPKKPLLSKGKKKAPEEANTPQFSSTWLQTSEPRQQPPTSQPSVKSEEDPLDTATLPEFANLSTLESFKFNWMDIDQSQIPAQDDEAASSTLSQTVPSMPTVRGNLPASFDIFAPQPVFNSVYQTPLLNTSAASSNVSMALELPAATNSSSLQVNTNGGFDNSRTPVPLIPQNESPSEGTATPLLLRSQPAASPGEQPPNYTHNDNHEENQEPLEDEEDEHPPSYTSSSNTNPIPSLEALILDERVLPIDDAPPPPTYPAATHNRASSNSATRRPLIPRPIATPARLRLRSALWEMLSRSATREKETGWEMVEGSFDEQSLVAPAVGEAGSSQPPSRSFSKGTFKRTYSPLQDLISTLTLSIDLHAGHRTPQVRWNIQTFDKSFWSDCTSHSGSINITDDFPKRFSNTSGITFETPILSQMVLFMDGKGRMMTRFEPDELMFKEDNEKNECNDPLFRILQVIADLILIDPLGRITHHYKRSASDGLSGIWDRDQTHHALHPNWGSSSSPALNYADRALDTYLQQVHISSSMDDDEGSSNKKPDEEYEWKILQQQKNEAEERQFLSAFHLISRVYSSTFLPSSEYSADEVTASFDAFCALFGENESVVEIFSDLSLVSTGEELRRVEKKWVDVANGEFDLGFGG